MYHLVVTDSGGHSQSVVIAFVSAEAQSNIVGRFYHGQVAAVKLETILVDRDYKEIDAWTATFPRATIAICLVHVERVK